MVLQKIEAWPCTFGGESHYGWLPPHAATPQPTPIEHELLDVWIEDCDGGYLLVWTAKQSDTCRELVPPKLGDTWHKTIKGAEAAAQEWFGIESSDWM